MIRHSHKLLLAAVLSGFSAVSVGSVEAGCHGRSSGGYSGGHSYSSSYSHGHFSQPVYSPPVYRKPVYPQPTYPQPHYQQPVYAQGGYGQPPAVYGQPPLQTFPQSQLQQQPQFQAQPQNLQQPQLQGGVAMNGTAINGSPANGQQQPQQPQVQVSQQQVQMSQQQVQVQQQQQLPLQQLQAGTAQAAAPQAFAPQNASPPAAALAQPPAAVAPNGNVTANIPPANDAQQSALQALGGFAPPQNAAVQSAIEAPQSPQATFTGAWTANLSNGARVQLSLQADGNFNWVAVNKDGQASSFQGTYSMENGSLSLSRSTDGQKLTGSMTASGANNFSFKLSDAQASSLDFVRG